MRLCRRSSRLIAVLALMAAALLVPTGVAHATEPGPPRTVAVTAPPMAAAGEAIDSTATVKDAFGNAVPGATVVFTETGPGRFLDGDIVIATTGPGGEASAVVRSEQSEIGIQTVRATIGGETSECGRAAGDPAGSVDGVCAHAAGIEWTSGLSTIALSGAPSAGVWGTIFSLTGVLRFGGAPLGGRLVRVERRLASQAAFEELVLATTSEDGLFAVEDRPSERAEFRAFFDGEPGYGPATSGIARILVRYGVALNVQRPRLLAGSITALGGRVLPANPRGVVHLQQFSPFSGWRTIAAVRLDRNSRFSFRVLKRAPGLLLFRALVPGDALRAWNVSINRRIDWL